MKSITMAILSIALSINAFSNESPIDNIIKSLSADKAKVRKAAKAQAKTLTESQKAELVKKIINSKDPELKEFAKEFQYPPKNKLLGVWVSSYDKTDRDCTWYMLVVQEKTIHLFAAKKSKHKKLEWKQHFNQIINRKDEKLFIKIGNYKDDAFTVKFDKKEKVFLRKSWDYGWKPPTGLYGSSGHSSMMYSIWTHLNNLKNKKTD